ncbi:MAG: transposase [Haliea sp.]|nr:transposase [Haliea sp.]
MRQGYFWPLYGDADEMVFRYAPSREHRHVTTFLGEFQGTLLSGGYEAYAAYAKGKSHIIHAQCWAHCRRYFEQARDRDPAASAEALALIGVLYRHEEILRERELGGEEKRDYRMQHSEPVVQAFWAWCDRQCHRPDLLPTSPVSKALKYAMSRQGSLQAFLADPNVPNDTNHLGGACAPFPWARKLPVRLTEIGAERIGFIQSLLATCRLQGVNPYTYLVDVLQRINVHPASKVIELTPRVWKEKFADNPMKSDLAMADQ